MRIAIDISQIVYGTGVSTYTRMLTRSLLDSDKDNQYTLFAGSLRRRGDVASIFPAAKIFPIPPTLADFIWNKIHLLPIESLIGDIDVFHSSDWTEPPSKVFKVTTIHDLYPLKFPKLIDPKILEVQKRRLGWVFQESNRIIVPSNSTRDDLIQFGVSNDRLRVIPEAPSLTRASEDEIIRVERKYAIKDNYLLAIGATRLKNTENIIRAFHLARASKKVKLIILGRPVGIKTPDERNIRFLGYTPQSDIAPLLSGSKGLLFASLYEGFGLPILDAFSCGVPVMTSRAGSMPEVSGDAAVLVDPYDIDSIADGIKKILNSPKNFIEKGKRRLKNFSWEKTANLTLSVYNELR